MLVKTIDYQKLEIIGAGIIRLYSLGKPAFMSKIQSKLGDSYHTEALYLVTGLLINNLNVDAYLRIISIAGRDDCYFTLHKLISFDKYHIKIYIIK